MEIKGNKKVTVKDIAKALNVAQSTITKALTNKSGVSEEKRAEICRAAKEMGYKVNRVGQSLSRAIIKIGVISPYVWTEYYGLMRRGIEDAINSLSDFKVFAEYYNTSGLFAKDEIEAAVDVLIGKRVNAVILCPASVSECDAALKKLQQKQIPVIVLGADLACAPELRVASVMIDADKAGRLAAELMDWLTSPNALAAVFIGTNAMNEHRKKAAGFERIFSAAGKRIAGIYETEDDLGKAYAVTHQLLKSEPGINCIYVATANSVPVCSAIAETDMRGKIKIICTDKTHETTRFLKNGDISALIFQDPVRQGQIATELIYRYLIERKYSGGDVLVEPVVVLKNNVVN